MRQLVRADNLTVFFYQKLTSFFHASVLFLTMNFRQSIVKVAVDTPAESRVDPQNFVKVLCGSTRVLPRGSTASSFPGSLFSASLVDNIMTEWKAEKRDPGNEVGSTATFTML